MSALRADVIITDQLSVILEALRVTGVAVRVCSPGVGVGVRLRGETVSTALLTPSHVGEVGSGLQTHSVSVREGSSDTVTTHSFCSYNSLNIFNIYSQISYQLTDRSHCLNTAI